MHTLKNLAIITAALCFASTAAIAEMSGPAPAPAKTSRSCFLSTQFENWKSPDPKTIYIRVTGKNYYRLDLSAPCYTLRVPGAYLITKFRGPNTVCSAVDWDLKVVDGPNGIPQACIVKAMTKLTPKEVAAIPKKFKP